MRIDYTPKRGYFFETFLSSEEETTAAVENVSNHLTSGGIFILSVQNGPGRDMKHSSTPEYELLEDGYVATKVIEERGNIRIKRRELSKDGKLVGGITHRFFVIDLNEFNELALRYGLQDNGFDATKHAYLYSEV